MRKQLKHIFIPHKHNKYAPHFFREASVIGIASLIIFIFGLSFLQSSLLTKTNLGAAILPSVLVDLTNENRKSLNLSSLTTNQKLESAASMKSQDMATMGYFSHNSPTGITPWYWFQRAGYSFKYAGENLAIDFSDSSAVEDAWMNSPAHRANITYAPFSDIGIAVAPGVYNGRSTLFVVQMFGTPAAAEAVSTVPPVSAVARSVAGGGEKGQIEEKNIKVLGERLTASSTFIMAENKSATSAIATTSFVSAGLFWRILLVSPQLFLRYSYSIIGFIVLVALILLVAIEFRRQHPKHALYGLGLIVLLGILYWVGTSILGTVIVL